MSRGTLNLSVCVCVCLCVCISAFRHFTTSCFSKWTSEPSGRKISHHLLSVTNNIFWIMIASIGFCICKCEVMNFLCEQWKRSYYATFLQQACWMRDGRSFSDKLFPLKYYFCGKNMLHINISIEYTSAPDTLAGSRRCSMWSETGEGLWHVEWLQRVGLSKGFFGALDWIDACHTHVMHSLPDEPRRAAINTIFASKCIYLICEPMTVSLDLWSKARFN